MGRLNTGGRDMTHSAKEARRLPGRQRKDHVGLKDAIARFRTAATDTAAHLHTPARVAAWRCDRARTRITTTSSQPATITNRRASKAYIRVPHLSRDAGHLADV